jgi:hypothetical protein
MKPHRISLVEVSAAETRFRSREKDRGEPNAGGAPVLVMLAVAGDAMVFARAIAAAEFLQRVGDALATAVPEAALCPGAPGRVLVIGSDTSASVLEQIRRLTIPALHVCRLEPFRIAGQERFAVRWMHAGDPAAVTDSSLAATPEFAVPEMRLDLWKNLSELCLRIDSGVRIDGDRYLRRISWQGRPLGEVRLVHGVLHAVPAEGPARELASASDVRHVADQFLRHYAKHAGLTMAQSTAANASAASLREAAPRHAAHGSSGPSRNGESLRSVLAAARLSPEEYSALGGPASVAGGEADGAAVADDVVRIVSAQESSWSPPRRPD